MTYLLGHDLIGAPPTRNFGLSHSYRDRDATDLTLAPQESQSVGRNACHENPPHMVPATTRTWDHEHAHRIPHRWATPPGALFLWSESPFSLTHYPSHKNMTKLWNNQYITKTIFISCYFVF